MLMHAEGCEVMWQPSYLKELGLGDAHPMSWRYDAKLTVTLLAMFNVTP